MRAATLIAVVALSAAAATGCAGPSAAARGAAARSSVAEGSVAECTRFAVAAIRQRVTVTTRPPACRGLTRLQVNLAVAGALHSVAAGLRGKARQRERMVSASRYVQGLVTSVPAQRSRPVVAPAGRQASRLLLGLIAVSTWVITVGLGLSVLAGWIGRRRRDPAGPCGRLPARNGAHLGLAVTGLLAWVVYLATGEIGVAWAACALLLPTAGLGMTLVFLSPPQARRPPVLAVGAHIAFATATILFALLTAVGTG